MLITLLLTICFQELQRVDMLHEERWAFVLTHLDHEMSRRIARIEAENAKTLSNDCLSASEKQDIICRKTALLTNEVIYFAC